MELANQSSAEVLQQEKYKHQRDHAAIANQHEYAEQADDDVRQTDERPQRDEVLRGSGRECVERDPSAVDITAAPLTMEFRPMTDFIKISSPKSQSASL